MPNIFAAGFHIELGDGWRLKPNKHGNYVGRSESYVSSTGASILGNISGNDKNYFVQITSNSNESKLDGRTYSFLIEKTENFNSNNSAINVVFKKDDFILNFDNNKHNYIVKDSNDTSPRMKETQEYLVGDANNDGRVNAIDASWVSMKTTNNQYHIVDEIKYSYKDIFTEANCAAAPDANMDGIINRDDADAISQYYMDMSTSGDNNTRIGKYEFYEIFE